MKIFNRICYMVCIFSLVMGLVIALIITWCEAYGVLAWKLLGTTVAFFFASAMALAINMQIMKQQEHKSDQKNN